VKYRIISNGREFRAQYRYRFWFWQTFKRPVAPFGTLEPYDFDDIEVARAKIRRDKFERVEARRYRNWKVVEVIE